MHFLSLMVCCEMSKSIQLCVMPDLQTKPWPSEPGVMGLICFHALVLVFVLQGFIRGGLHTICFHVTWGPCFKDSIQGSSLGPVQLRVGSKKLHS